MTTKQEIIDELYQCEKELTSIKAQLGESRQETRRFQTDAENAKRRESDYESKLIGIKHVIESTLKVKFEVGVQPQSAWVNGRDVGEGDLPEEVRLLRHIHDIARTDPPF